MAHLSVVPVGDARDHFSELISEVERTHERVTVTRHGRPVAVALSPDDLESLEETLDILSQPGARSSVSLVSDEPFQIPLTATAQRCLYRLPEKIVGACIEFISGPLAVDPHRIGTPLQRELAGHHSARCGAYRVVYRIDDSVRTVFVVRIDHRGDVSRSR